MNHFDTVIVGAGAAGSVLAARLSRDDRRRVSPANRTRRVLLIEAGPDFPDGNLPEEIRYGFGRHPDLWALAFGYETRFGWDYRARATRHQPDMFVPRGRIVGGSSAVNAQIFLRGVPEDYDGWAELGCPDWSFAELLPSLRRIETDHDFRDPYHGSDGPIPVRRFPPEELRPEQQAFLDACRDAGYDACPNHNAPDSTGVGPVPLNSHGGVRWSAAMGYLEPARGRSNLTILPDRTVHRLLIEHGRALGVTLRGPGASEREPQTVYGDEIVLAAGAIGTPHLLLRSGIGPAGHLRRVGVPVACDLRGVGANLRDHPQVSVTARTPDSYRHADTAPRLQTALRYTAAGSPLRNDMIMLPTGRATTEGYFRRSRSEPIGFHLVPALYLAAAAGSVRLRSPRPEDPPELDYNLLGEPVDRERMREGVRIAIELLRHPSFRPLVAEVVNPTPAELASDAALDDWLLRTTATSHHVSSTCRMGAAGDPDSVVDQEGRVYGVDRLRVADASIMPDCVRANTNCTSMAIGERIAEFMLR